MPKMYFAEFIDTETGKIFQKFGHTRFKDAQMRLDNITKDYPKYSARILAAAYHNDVTKCQGAEEAFQAMYPKNFWLEEKLSGISECVVLDSKERKEVIDAIQRLNKKFKKECFGEDSTRSPDQHISVSTTTD